MSTMIDGHWLPSNRSDPRVIALYRQHYSARRDRGTWSHGITGPGEDMVLLTESCDAIFAWVRCIRNDDQAGVNCSVFRNEGGTLSSDLIREADELAWQRWPDEPRHFTYVAADKVRHKRDTGRCFIKAGWRRCGVSKGGLLIFEITDTPRGSEEAGEPRHAAGLASRGGVA